MKSYLFNLSLVFLIALNACSKDPKIEPDEDTDSPTDHSIDLTQYYIVYTLKSSQNGNNTPIRPYAHLFTSDKKLLPFGSNNNLGANYVLEGNVLRLNTTDGSLWFKINMQDASIAFQDANNFIEIDKYQLVKKTDANTFDASIAGKTFSGSYAEQGSQFLSTIQFKFSADKFIHHGIVIGTPPAPSYTITDKMNAAFCGVNGANGYRGVIIEGRLYVYWNDYLSIHWGVLNPQ